MVDLWEYTADLGLAVGEPAVMKTLLDETRRVEKEYGVLIAFFAENAAEIPRAFQILRALQQAAPVAEAFILRKEEHIRTISANGSIYEPV